MQRLTMRIVTVAIAVVALGARAGASCMGDLDADGRVNVAEVVHMVACALVGPSGEVQCGSARIEDLVQAVRNAMYGCDTVWLEKATCRQCEPCALGVSGPLAALGDLVADLEADGITVIDAKIEPVGITCLACGVCPAGFYFAVLVPERDRARLLELGWQ